MNINQEPKEAFPYKPPTEEIKEKYAHIFLIDHPLPDRLLKVFFDKIISLILLLISTPLLIILKLAYVIEGLIIPENKGDMFFYYYAVSAGKIIPKYKIRLIKNKFIATVRTTRGDEIDGACGQLVGKLINPIGSKKVKKEQISARNIH